MIFKFVSLLFFTEWNFSDWIKVSWELKEPLRMLFICQSRVYKRWNKTVTLVREKKTNLKDIDDIKLIELD